MQGICKKKKKGGFKIGQVAFQLTGKLSVGMKGDGEHKAFLKNSLRFSCPFGSFVRQRLCLGL